jgi:hypothetical protein
VGKLAAAAAALFAAPVALAVFVAAVAAAEPASTRSGLGGPPSAQARREIPEGQLADYRRAAAEQCPGMPWSVLAAVAAVESDHATTGGATVGPDGEVAPWIIGPALDGRAGVRRIPDTDSGRWDGDAVWDHAVGPLQFIPTAWAAHGIDADGDGTANPHTLADAAHTAARYLCANDADQPAHLAGAVRAYNTSEDYVADVLTLAADYSQTPSGTRAAGGYALPVRRELLSLEAIRRPHHDYPAWDLPLPAGTPVAAVHRGTVTSISDGGRCGNGVTVAGADGATYTYCHGHHVTATEGQQVRAGQVIMRSGDSGNSTGPHLHLAITRADGTTVCPQPLLEAWYRGQPLGPGRLSTGSCVG